jgi:site-specific recombinase XerD
VLAQAYDLKVFFTVVDKTPVRVTPADVMAFIRSQRASGSNVVAIDGSSGLSPRTIRRRVSTVSTFYAYVLARGGTSVTRRATQAIADGELEASTQPETVVRYVLSQFIALSALSRSSPSREQFADLVGFMLAGLPWAPIKADTTTPR